MSDRRPTDDVMARELIAARARIAELEHERDALRQLVRAAAVASVAAQRPPLGYVVGFETAHGLTFGRDYGGPIPTRAGAEQEMANEVQEDPGVSWKLLEVREVQP